MACSISSTVRGSAAWWPTRALPSIAATVAYRLALVIACGHLAAGVAVAEEVRVRVIDAVTGTPSKA